MHWAVTVYHSLLADGFYLSIYYVTIRSLDEATKLMMHLM